MVGEHGALHLGRVGRSSESQVARRDEHEPLLPRERDAGPGFGRPGEHRERDIERAVADVLAELRRVAARDEVEPDIGVRLAERGERGRAAAPRRGSVSHRCCSRPARPLATSSASCSARRMAASAVSARVDQRASDDRRCGAMTAAREQRRADLRLDPLEAAAQWRLRDVELPRRRGQRTSAANCHHELQIASIHTATVTNTVVCLHCAGWRCTRQ